MSFTPTLTNLLGLHTIVAKAYIIPDNNYPYSEDTSISFQVEVKDYCTVLLAWNTLPTMSDTTYSAGDAAMTITFADVTWTPTNCTSTI